MEGREFRELENEGSSVAIESWQRGYVGRSIVSPNDLGVSGKVWARVTPLPLPSQPIRRPVVCCRHVVKDGTDVGDVGCDVDSLPTVDDCRVQCESEL